MKVNITINEKVTEMCVQIQVSTFNEETKQFLAYIESFKKQREILSIKTMEGIQVIAIEEIESIEVYQDIVHIFTESEVFQTRDRLYKVIEKLQENDFVQVSKSNVINLKKLKKLENSFSGTMVAITQNQRKINVSRKYLPILKEKIGV